MSIAERLSTAWTQHTQHLQQGPSLPRTYCYASGWWPCRYRMYLDCVMPENNTFDEYSQEAAKRGNEYEENVTARLNLSGKYEGFRIEGQQEPVLIEDREGNKIISGKLEGRVAFSRTERYIYEIKAGRGVQGVETVSDLNRGPYNPKKLRQLLVYLLGKGEPQGVFILETFAKPTFLDVFLEDWLPEAEEFLEAATEVCAAARGEAPPPERTESTLCERCDHRGTCAPSIGSAVAAGYSDDPEVIEAARQVVDLKESADQYKKAKKVLERYKGQPMVVIGDYLYSGKWWERTEYDIPEDIKKPYKTVKEEGAWVATVERVTDDTV